MKHPENKEIPVHHEHKQHCDCGPDCECGCQEGKECICNKHEHCSCSFGSKCTCNCRCRCGIKILAVILIFLAGMGFNELLHGGFHCKAKNPMFGHYMPYKAGFPLYTDGTGNTIIYINTNDGNLNGKHGFNGCTKHHNKNQQKHSVKVPHNMQNK